MSVLVTGGLGFIGAKVVIQLLKRDIPVIVADLDIEKNKVRLEENISKIGKDKKLVSYQKLDITNYQNIETIFILLASKGFSSHIVPIPYAKFITQSNL